MRKTNYILGRRIQGNLGPLQTDPISQLPGRIMGPCVNLTGTDQDIYTASPTQNYALGSCMVADERTFHYCRAGAALQVITTTRRLHIAADQCLAINDRLATAISAILATTVTVAIAGFGAVALNELAGGWVEIWRVGGGYQHRRIVGNTASAGAADVTVTLEHGLEFAVAVGDQITLQRNIYRNVQDPTAAGLAGFQTPVCLPPIWVPINNFFWGQTWGPCYVDPTGVWPGAVANFRDVYYHVNGEINSSQGEGIGAGVNNSPMRVGYALPAGNYGTGMIMLQLAP